MTIWKYSNVIIYFYFALITEHILKLVLKFWQSKRNWSATKFLCFENGIKIQIYPWIKKIIA